MPLRFDHTIFLAADANGLDIAAARFAARGFTVTTRPDRDRDTAPTAQKLVCFDDGSYIEILAIRDAAARTRHRFASLLGKRDGWADYSLVTDDLEADRGRLLSANLPVSGPHEHARELDGGERWGVRLILAGIGAGYPALPFLLQDTAGRDLRIPRGNTHHANGAVGTAGVMLAVRDLAVVEPQFTILFGEGKRSPQPPAGASRGLRFHMDRQWIEVVEVASGTSPLANHIEQRGEGLVSVTFASTQGGDFSLDAKALTAG
jgi:hypothetical protein